MLTPRKALFAAALVLLCCALLGQRWTGWLTRPVSHAVDTVQWPAGWVASQWKSNPPIAETDATDQQLRDRLRAEQRYNAELWAENDELRRQLEAFEAISIIRDIKAILPVQSQVSAYNADPDNPTMKLLRGSLHGVQRDDAVVDRENLVGFVHEVGPVTATVKLVTGPGFRSEVMIMPPGQTRAENNWPYIDWVRSDGEGGFYLDVAQAIGEALRPGDVVRIRDALRKSANGFVLGRVASVVEHPTNPKQLSRVLIATSVPVGPQREVTVITERND